MCHFLFGIPTSRELFCRNMGHFIMKRWAFFWIALYAAVVVFAETPTTQPAPAQKVNAVERIKQRHQWFHKITVEAYETAGKRHPRWDSSVRTMFAAWTKLQSNVGKNLDEDDEIWI